jgi:hypothetical protein
MTKPTEQELREFLPNISEDNLALNTGGVGKIMVGNATRTSVLGAVAQNLTTKRTNKYNAIPTAYNGVVYHSKKEAEYAQTLDMRLKAGELDYILRQVPFPLPGNPPIIYRADFVALHFWDDGDYQGWDITVYEVKGLRTKEWVMKEKLFKATYPNLTLEVV